MRLKVVALGRDPEGLVHHALKLRDEAAERAERERDENLAYDEVWCVLDVDEHSRFDAARYLAERHGIRLAVSNPCFELWLILHFREHAAHLTSRKAADLLGNHIPEYRKHIRYEDLAGGYTNAVVRAASLERRHSEVETRGGNPSTGVHYLTERVRELGKGNRL